MTILLYLIGIMIVQYILWRIIVLIIRRINETGH